MSKKTLGRAADLLSSAANIALSGKIPDITYLGALEALIRIELLALGLTEREIELSARFQLYPQDCRIKKLIKEFPPDKSIISWARQPRPVRR